MRKTAILVALALLAAVPAFAQQTGTITGTATDEQAAVLPGVTVTVDSPALITPRSTTTGAGGSYSHPALPPGDYTVTFALSGFQTVVQEGVRVSVARTLEVNASMGISGVEETVTVTGDAPVVDVRSATVQTNIERELLEAVPTGRNPWVMAGMVPGMVTGQLDVGGSNGMQQYSMEIFGSSASMQSFNVDGLKVNWPGGDGGWTMQYYGFSMYEEFNFQTSTHSAESDTGGVMMNMVVKSGGNEFSGDAIALYNAVDLQGEPVETGANPITRAIDLNGTLGGPIVRDKAWFFTAYRYWIHDQEVSVPADYVGPQPIDDNLIRNLSGKFTWQASDNDRIAVTLQRNWKQRFHRRDNPYRGVADELARFQDQWADNYIGSYNRVIGDTALLDIRLGKMTGVTPYILYSEYCGIPVDEYPDAGPCTENDISVVDPVRREMFNADYRGEFWGPNHRNQFNGSLTYYLDTASGSHNFKVGGQASREYAESRVFKSGDAYGELSDGVPSRINISRTPQTGHTRLNTWAFYAQDAWTIGDRLTLNIGVRLDGIYGYVPVQSSPAGTWTALSQQLSDAVFEVTSEIGGLPDWPMSVGPRLSFAYDLFGDGRAALKGGWGRYYTQTGSALPNSANPNGGASAWVGWNDLDGDKLVDLGPSGTLVDSPELDLSKFEGFTGGATTVYDKDANRPYSDDISLGVDMTLGSDVSFSATYHRRQHRDSLGRLNQARPASAYTLTSFECAACPQATYEVYELQEAYRGLQDNVVTSVDLLQSDYNGVAFQLQKRLSNNWQILGGATFSSHKGVVHNLPRDGSDWNNPNRLINRQNGSILTDLPWVVNFAGSYQAPWDIQLGWNYRARAGNPLVATARATGLVQGSESIYAYERGEERTEAVTTLLDFNLRKMVDLGDARFEVGVDAGNIFNSQPALSLNTSFGSRYLSPTRSLTPRIVRFTAKLLF
ncbi:MAG: TonB-dependent receptor [Acidobacteria bacterium]|nr:TonB-dependent receptor [Acidobacteriota bacterium]MYK78571.1 TonB-dependent receptor [Acidobacteriota bacterium]